MVMPLYEFRECRANFKTRHVVSWNCSQVIRHWRQLALCSLYDLADRRDTVEHLGPAVITKDDHAVLECYLFDLAGAGALQNKIANVVIHEHQLEQAFAAFEAGVATLATAFAF